MLVDTFYLYTIIASAVDIIIIRKAISEFIVELLFFESGWMLDEYIEIIYNAGF